ncbi:MAG: HDIG domain-containing protein [Bacteroidales bacterium]|nr:HDIG domain-containing protein [Bacteroidales bacterium]
MKKYPLPTRFQTYIPYLIIVVFLALMMPKSARFEYDYRKGSPWKYEALVADFDFPLYKTDTQIKEELSNSSSSVIPYYKFSDEVTAGALKAVDAALQHNGEQLRGTVVSSVRNFYNHGVISDENIKLDRKFGVVSEDLVYIQKEKRAVKYPLSEVYKVSDARQKLKNDIVARFPSANVDSLLRYSGVLDAIVPNLIFDRATTEMAGSGAKGEISPTQGFVSAGTLIVSEGEMVTSEIQQMIDSYKKEYDANMGSESPVLVSLLGDVFLSLIIVLILFLSVFFANPKMFDKKGEHYYILFIFSLASLPAMIMSRIESSYLIFLMPMTIIALYLQAFFRNRMIISVYIVSLIPLLIFVPQGGPLFVMYLLAGLVAIAMFQTFNKGWMQFVTAMAVFLTLTLSYLAFRAIGAVNGIFGRDVLHLFIGSLLSVAAYPLIYLFEKVFGLLSISRLDELADTNNPLLRELEVKAPGTFQHSLQVMSMADCACRAVNANAHLVRAGALYHDIGKIGNPQCFIENESLLMKGDGAKYHTGLTPLQSARHIIRHVTEGLEIADANHLPDALKDFIATHHGTNTVTYFYNIFINEGGDPAREGDFRYPGRKPVSKEQVILMLCDSLEAASRTLKEYTAESFSNFVESIVESKIAAGQLSESNISIKELGLIKVALKSYLAQMYHERVEYPDQKTDR